MRPELFIGGRWRAGRGEPFASHDPATGAEVWRGAGADAQDVAEAMAAARAAFPGWARTPRDTRIALARRFGEIVKARAQDFAETISRETGKVLWDSLGEAATVSGKVELSIRAQQERAGDRKDDAPFGALTLTHRPLGVMAVFGPFNFPAHLPNGHIVPALLAGDVVIFKPSELTPGVAALMVACWEEAGLPAGVLNLVQGGRETGAALLAQEGLNGVLFTGSAQTGLHIHRQFAGRPDVILALEMGGNNPLIAHAPADPAAAANLIAHSAFVTSGQRCSCARRLIVPDDAFGRDVIEAARALTQQIAVGAWTDRPEPFMGPLVRARAADAALAFEADLVARGGKHILPLARDGAFVRPGMIDVTGVDAPDEELFGPLLQVRRVRDLDAAVHAANDTRYGLAGGLICDDPAVWARVREELRAGVLNWNRPTTGASGAAPFGGPGLSGSLRPSAYYAADYVAYPVASQVADAARAIPAAGLPS
ncbi:MAG: succinylglutamate-semialdehyde dehydrogenase [Hyphomonadaceae bacterium]|nr:succinylglutamate-semialdehyde dehydrogenase [Hyphomonadaceae bacterium]